MAQIFWKNPVSGDWDVASNWSTDTVPTSSDDVTIAAPGAYTVTVSSADQAAGVTFDAPSGALVENAGSLTIPGTLVVDSGMVSLNEANTIGGVDIVGGELAFGNVFALGSAAVAMFGGELLATGSETLINALSVSGASTIVAATGSTLVVESSITLEPSSILEIGSIGGAGTIVWAGGSVQGSLGTVDVLAGTLKAADQFSSLTQEAPTTLNAGATIDVAGFDTIIDTLTGDGTVTDSGGPATLTLTGDTPAGDFTPQEISGPLSLFFQGNASLSGLEDYTGSATLEPAASVTITGTYDLVANSNINATSISTPPTFTNDNLFEKTGGGGVSAVTTDFVNNGTLNVLSGSIEFSGGFTNNGVIHGLVTKAKIARLGEPFEVTVSAPVASDFNGDTLSDILLQNANTGQASIWDMDGNARTGGGAVSSNPGPNWKAIGTGDFDGDGHADILWQNANGQASIWEMNGNTLIGGGAVSPNPGPSWTAVGTGDFNGDGLADILWQNTSTGQASIWEMNGNARSGGGALSVNAGPAWKAIGSGDFNGDGFSDILFQNTSTGQVSIWEMDGNQRIGGGALSINPGPAWKAIGTGDFNDDGLADILFQNTSTGQVSIWEMDGTTRIGGGAVSVNPGPDWKAVGTGDFNGDGHSDILFQNTSSGQSSIWEMDGTGRIGGGVVSANPGTSWRAVGA